MACFVSDALLSGFGVVPRCRVGVLGVSVTPQTVLRVKSELFGARLSPRDAQKVDDGDESAVSLAVGVLEDAVWR